MSKWDKIFSAGTHTDSSGMTRKWSRADLDALVKNSESDIPVVIRHPKNGEEVSHYGKIARLKRVGDDLLAQYHSACIGALDDGKNRNYSRSRNGDSSIIATACALVERGHSNVWQYGFSLFLQVAERATSRRSV